MSDNEDRVIGGKRYAGALINARPFAEMWPRCICGFLMGRDYHNRGFDNGSVRTSTVQNFHVEDGNLYAITLNSAYRLDSVNLLEFLQTPEWDEDIASLIASVSVK